MLLDEFGINVRPDWDGLWIKLGPGWGRLGIGSVRSHSESSWDSVRVEPFDPQKSRWVSSG